MSSRRRARRFSIAVLAIAIAGLIASALTGASTKADSPEVAEPVALVERAPRQRAARPAARVREPRRARQDRRASGRGRYGGHRGEGRLARSRRLRGQRLPVGHRLLGAGTLRRHSNQRGPSCTIHRPTDEALGGPDKNSAPGDHLGQRHRRHALGLRGGAPPLGDPRLHRHCGKLDEHRRCRRDDRVPRVDPRARHGRGAVHGTRRHHRIGASGHSAGRRRDADGTVATRASPPPRRCQPYILGGLGGFQTSSIAQQKGPMFLMSGSGDTVAVPAQNQQPVFDMTNVPVFWGTLQGATHTGTAIGNIGGYRGPATAWVRLQLMGDESARGFVLRRELRTLRRRDLDRAAQGNPVRSGIARDISPRGGCGISWAAAHRFLARTDPSTPGRLGWHPDLRRSAQVPGSQLHDRRSDVSAEGSDPVVRREAEYLGALDKAAGQAILGDADSGEEQYGAVLYVSRRISRFSRTTNCSKIFGTSRSV